MKIILSDEALWIGLKKKWLPYREIAFNFLQDMAGQARYMKAFRLVSEWKSLMK